MQQRKPKPAPGSNPGTSTLCDNSVMEFGKHQGAALRDIPDRYLGFLWKRDGYGFSTFGERRDFPGALADYIERRFEAKRARTPRRLWPKYLQERARHQF